MQLQHLNLDRNRLVGSLPETWRRFTSVSLTTRADLLIPPVLVYASDSAAAAAVNLWVAWYGEKNRRKFELDVKAQH